MKVDGITLLQMIRDGKVNDKTKINAYDNSLKIELIYDKEYDCLMHNEDYISGESNHETFNFTSWQLLNFKFQIIEQEEDKETKPSIDFITSDIKEMIEIFDKEGKYRYANILRCAICELNDSPQEEDKEIEELENNVFIATSEGWTYAVSSIQQDLETFKMKINELTRAVNKLKRGKEE